MLRKYVCWSIASVAVLVSLFLGERFLWRRPTLWTFRASDGVGTNIVIDDDGGLFVGMCDGTIFALDRVTGRERWHSSSGVPFSPEIALGSKDILCAFDGRVLALDRVTGHHVWAFKPLSGQCRVAVGGGGTVFACADRVYALAAATGRKRWITGVGGPVDWCSAGTGPDLYAITGYPDDRIYALSQSSGKVVWTSGGTSRYLTMAVGPSGELVAEDNVGRICRLDGFDGHVVSRERLGRSELVNIAVGSHGVVYTSCSSGAISAYDGRTCERLWTMSTGLPAASPPAVCADKWLFVGGGLDRVLILSCKTGAILNTRRVASFADNLSLRARMAAIGVGTPVIDRNGHAYVGTGSGTICAFDANALR